MPAKRFDDTREHLLATGEALMLGKGFSAVGLAEILAAAQVPKGSFYHYFESKEGYGVAMLQRYFERYISTLDELIAQTEVSGLDKLQGYFAGWRVQDATHCPTGGDHRCLVVKLTGEVSDLSDQIRSTLKDGIAQIIQRLEWLISAGRSDGSIPQGLPANELAAALYQLWLGTALVSKVNRDESSITNASRCTTYLLGLSNLQG